MGILADRLVVDLLGIVVALLAVAYVWIKWSYQYWEKRNVPYLPPAFLWGNILPPHKRTISFGEDVANIYKRAKDKGWKYLGIYALTSPVYMPLDLDIIKNIMSKDFNHFVDRGVYVNEKVEPISAHLFSIGGVKWRNLRTKFSPTFTSGKMKTMFQTVAKCGSILENYIRNEVDANKPLDIKSVLACYSTDIIGSCAFGLECNTFKEPDTPFRQFGDRVFNLNKFLVMKLTFANQFPDVARFLGMRILSKDIEQFFTKVVDDTIKYRERNNVVRHDFLQMCIDIKNDEEQSGDGTSLTLEEIVAQSFVFFIAGFETSSTTMTFTLYELAINPDIQEKVRNEIKTVLAKHDNQINYDALNELKYMGQVIDETLRKYPPVPFVTRKCVEDYKVPNSDLIIKKGIRVFIPIRGIHYDEDYYEASEVFDPERFSDENKQTRHPYAHIPFGEGPRICIGMRFGIMQTKVGLLSVLKNFRVSLNKKTSNPLKLSPTSFIPTTEGGIWLDLNKLN
ncbi:unnamed protein product [Phaedon cochleariae]|uniref:Cytochrome P450 n=1 Tax=Phaedon cochleariae TaxID=80249 RepID=A0A9N9SJK7_PHACE|nr:unnamed protein product [Phaedon cochleariae]